MSKNRGQIWFLRLTWLIVQIRVFISPFNIFNWAELAGSYPIPWFTALVVINYDAVFISHYLCKDPGKESTPSSSELNTIWSKRKERRWSCQESSGVILIKRTSPHCLQTKWKLAEWMVISKAAVWAYSWLSIPLHMAGSTSNDPLSGGSKRSSKVMNYHRYPYRHDDMAWTAWLPYNSNKASRSSRMSIDDPSHYICWLPSASLLRSVQAGVGRQNISYFDDTSHN